MKLVILLTIMGAQHISTDYCDFDIDNSGKMHGKRTCYDGTLKKIPVLEEHYKNGKLHGKVLYSDRFERLLCKANYINGKKHGTLISHYGGHNNFKYYYGTLHGPFKSYYSDKTIKITGKHRNGKLHGKVVEFYPSGKKHSETDYVSGEIIQSVAWHENGNKSWKVSCHRRNIKGERYYDNGMLHWRAIIVKNSHNYYETVFEYCRNINGGSCVIGSSDIPVVCGQYMATEPRCSEFN